MLYKARAVAVLLNSEKGASLLSWGVAPFYFVLFTYWTGFTPIFAQASTVTGDMPDVISRTIAFCFSLGLAEGLKRASCHLICFSVMAVQLADRV